MLNLKYFENTLDNNVFGCDPNEQYHDLEQEYIDDNWENTSIRYTIEEQDGYGELNFHKIEAWVNNVIATSTSGSRSGQDYLQFFFRNINHSLSQGLYYRFNDNYWLAYFYSKFQGIPGDTLVRRCNNALRIVDPVDGSIFEIPCVVEYDMGSPATQISMYVLTPNNHASVMVQSNSNTRRLFVTNTRYILGGRPFKLNGYQNALLYKEGIEDSQILYLDLYLDEKHARDDFERQVAYNGEYNYELRIAEDNIEVAASGSGQLHANVTLNGDDVKREIKWRSSDDSVVTVDETGRYWAKKLGSAVVSAIFGDLETTITIKVVEVNTEPYIELKTCPTKIREYDTAYFVVQVLVDGKEVSAEISATLDNGTTKDKNLELKFTKNTVMATCIKRDGQLHNINIKAHLQDGRDIVKIVSVRLVSMMG